jgi:hypothetical protein
MATLSAPRLLHRVSIPLLALCLQTGAAQAQPPKITLPDKQAPQQLFIPTPDGTRVYDVKHNVTWLVDANLAASNTFGVKKINPSGSMSYETAKRYVQAMNDAKYLNRQDWTLPVTDPDDPSCDRVNRHRFGWRCELSPLVNLFRTYLGLRDYQTAVPIPYNEVKGFRNFQPYIYWAGSHNVGHEENENGMVSFSFNNGFQGANVARNRMYVLPMIVGRIKVDGSKARKLKSPYVVYDADRDITWLADANYAALDDFGVPDIAQTGAMRHPTAEKWVAAMNAAGFLGSDRWQLPRSPEEDETCSAKVKEADCTGTRKECAVPKFGYNCQNSDLGGLYHGYLGLSRGTPVVKAPDTLKPADPTKPPLFRNVEPYLYWSCHMHSDDKRHCSTNPDHPAANFGWSFSFGNGFQGTTLGMNELYVWPYHPGRPEVMKKR